VARRNRDDRQLAQNILAQVEQCEPGDKIPTRKELAAKHDVSEYRIDKVVRLLVETGVLHVETGGRGTKVVAQPVPLVYTRATSTFVLDDHVNGAGTRWELECARQERDGQVVKTVVGHSPATADLARRLDVAPGAELTHRARVMLLEGLRAQVQDTWWPSSLVPAHLLDNGENADVRRIMRHAGTTPATAIEEVAARRAMSTEIRRLKLQPGATVLEVRRTIHDQRRRPVETTLLVSTTSLVTAVYGHAPIEQPPTDDDARTGFAARLAAITAWLRYKTSRA
jgi:GntR family transcriptional regulator